MNRQLNPKLVLKAMNLRDIPQFETVEEVGTYVTEYLWTKYAVDKYSINHGYCFIWAFLVWSLWQGKECKFVSTEGHVFIKCGRYYYDAKHVNGTTIKGRISDTDKYKVITVDQLFWFWGQVGRRKHEFRQVVREMIPNLYKKVRKKFIIGENEDGGAIYLEDIPASL